MKCVVWLSICIGITLACTELDIVGSPKAFCCHVTPDAQAHVTLNDTIVVIPPSAFFFCNLKTISIPNNVLRISEHAFSYSSLVEATIPSSVTYIGIETFMGCSDLTRIVFPEDNMLSFASTYSEFGFTHNAGGNNMFSACTNLTEVVNLPSITNLHGTFSGCSKLSELTIPDSAITISMAFSGTSMKSLTIPKSVSVIGESFCGACKDLVHVSIPTSVTYIGYAAFSGAISLPNITIPSSVQIIDQLAFSGCTSINNLVIPGATIEQYAFQNTPALRNLEILDGAIIKEGAFHDSMCIPGASYIYPPVNYCNCEECPITTTLTTTTLTTSSWTFIRMIDRSEPGSERNQMQALQGSSLAQGSSSVSTGDYIGIAIAGLLIIILSVIGILYVVHAKKSEQENLKYKELYESLVLEIE